MSFASSQRPPSIGVVTIELRAPISFFTVPVILRACYGAMRLYAPPGIVCDGNTVTCVHARLLLDPEEEMLYCFIADGDEAFSFPLSDVIAVFAANGKRLWPAAVSAE
ncbi:MAG: hypothetical protein HYU35_01565 [Parcubacteria group bacterium]|nr:hypothetical protein [Parcubacteria group bacterium]